jgi:hypothetical protein
MQLVAYSQVHPALIIDPAYPVVGHDEEENIMIMEDSTGIAAFCSYMSVIKVLGPRALFALKGTQSASVDY